MKFTNTNLVKYINSLRKTYVIKKKVLLVQAPQFLFSSFNPDIVKNRGYYAYPPTGLQCIAKALANRNIEINILDMNYLLLKQVIDNDGFDLNNWLVLLEKYLDKHTPSIVGVTSINVYSNVFTPDYPLTSILNYLQGKERYITIAGGPIATNEYKNYLEKELAHFVIDGEGENKITFLFDCLFDEKVHVEPISGIYFKFDNRVEQIIGQKDIVKLNGNLINTYDLIPIKDYNKVGSLNPYSRMVGQEKPFSVFQLNRGCRSNCDFCGVTDFMGNGVRNYPVKDVLEEIAFLVEKRGIRHFDVLDDDFLVNKKAVLDLLNGLVELREKYGTTWSSNNGLIGASVTEELMCLMRDSGCVGFRIGVESGNSDMLKRLRKPVSLSLLRKVGLTLNKFPEIFTGGNYIIGLLGEETFGEMLETFRFACELDLDWASFAVFQFTNSRNISSRDQNLNDRHTTDFVPSKSNSEREVADINGVLSGPDIFELPGDEIPSIDQIKQIWFSFNIVTNYINNKNLKPGGQHGKFTHWVEAVKVAYPDNPYMSLFAGIGRVLLGDIKLANRHLENTKSILDKSKYWNYRFVQFGLIDLVTSFSNNTSEIYRNLDTLRDKYSKWVK